MELLSVEFKSFESFEGYAANFAQIKLEGNIEPSLVLCYATRNLIGVKVHIISVGETPPGNKPFDKRTMTLNFPAGEANDLPMALNASNLFDVIYVVTRNGFIFVYDIESGICIYRYRISSETILASTLHRSTGGVLTIDRMGKVTAFTIDPNTIGPYVIQKFKNTDMANRFARRIEQERADGFLLEKFGNPLLKERTTEAAQTQMLRNKLGQLTWKGFLGRDGGNTGIRADQLYYCSQRNDNCGCNGKSCNGM